jgi:hypothetical protein
MHDLNLKHLELWLKDTPSDLAMLSLSEEEYTTLHDAFAILYRQLRGNQTNVASRDVEIRMNLRYIETINWLARSRDYGKS